MTSQLNPRECFRGQTLFITGATGFLAKVLVEKICRSLPEIERIYLLVRAKKGATSAERLEKEVISSEIFKRLRAERKDCNEFLRSKLVAVAGDVTLQDCGLSPSDLARLHDEVTCIMHCAAVVDFNERIDKAMELNTRGSLRMLGIAKKCRRLRSMVHVSTCYVNSNKRNFFVEEKLYPLGFEPREVMKQVGEVKKNSTDLEQLTLGGLLRDWPNTYTFTKAIAEHMLAEQQDHVPLVILRPSIIGASAQEPVPGWVDCISAAGAVYVAVAYGVLQVAPGNMLAVGDQIPVDHVVNAMIVAATRMDRREGALDIVQVSSSVANPLTWGTIKNVILSTIRDLPIPGQVARPGINILSPQMYQIQFFLRYSVPSALLSTFAVLGPAKMKKNAANYARLLWKIRVIVNSFRYFMENSFQFDNRQTRTLYSQLSKQDQKVFWMDVSQVDWNAYSLAFVYGIARYVLGLSMVDQPTTRRNYECVNKNLVCSEKKHLFPGNLLADVQWTQDQFLARTSYNVGRLVTELHEYVVSCPAVQQAITQMEGKSRKSRSALEAEARAISTKMFGQVNMQVLKPLAYLFRKVWRKLYDRVLVDRDAFQRVQQEMQRVHQHNQQHPLSSLAGLDGPSRSDRIGVIYLPTHRSYIDFLLMSYLCLYGNMPLPYIAAGEDFLGIFLVRYLFRNAGAFFLRRSFTGDPLYTAIFKAYTQQLLIDGQALEFFLEGTRSRSGKMLLPKTGLLSMLTEVVLEGRLKDVVIVPVTINYEKTMESNMYGAELMGHAKVKESLTALMKAKSIFNKDFGRVFVHFDKPFSFAEYTRDHVAETRGEMYKTLAGFQNGHGQPPSSMEQRSVGGSEPLPVTLSLHDDDSSANSNAPSSGPGSVLGASAQAVERAWSAVSSVYPGQLSKFDAKAGRLLTPADSQALTLRSQSSCALGRGGGSAQSLSTDGIGLCTSLLKLGAGVESKGEVGAQSSSQSSQSSGVNVALSKLPASIYDPYQNKVHRRYLNRRLAAHVIHRLCHNLAVMPTHMLGTLLLMYRQGIDRDRLVQEMVWLRGQIVARGGEVAGWAGEHMDVLVDKALGRLSQFVITTRQNILEPAINNKAEYRNMLALGHYRNQLVHIFFPEGVWALVVQAHAHFAQPTTPGRSSSTYNNNHNKDQGVFASAASGSDGGPEVVTLRSLLREVRFLHALLHREFAHADPNPDVVTDLDLLSPLVKLVKDGVLLVQSESDNTQESKGGVLPSLDAPVRLSLSPKGEHLGSFLTSVLWPFVDSYFVAIMYLFRLINKHNDDGASGTLQIPEKKVISRAQWLAITLYHESMLCHFEACSSDTMRNALHVLKLWKVINIQRQWVEKAGSLGAKASRVPASMVSLCPEFQEEDALVRLLQRVDRFRKQAVIRPPVGRTSLVSYVPMLAKL